MNKVYIILVLLFSFLNAKSQIKDSILQYPIVVKFNSECCGVPDGTPLRKGVLKFKKKQHLKFIESYKIGPLGREGEYMVAFTLKEMNKKQKMNFIKLIKSITLTMKDRGFAVYEENYAAKTTSMPSTISIEKVNF